MPQLGESVAEGTIGRWLKQPGDTVAKYEPLLEVITDKVNAEVPSPYAGVLREILAEEGATVPNNAEIAVIETDDEGAGAGADAVAAAPTAAPAAPAAMTAPAAATEPGPATGTADEPDRARGRRDHQRRGFRSCSRSSRHSCSWRRVRVSRRHRARRP